MCGQHVSSRAVLLRKAVLAAKGQVGSAGDGLWNQNLSSQFGDGRTLGLQRPAVFPHPAPVTERQPLTGGTENGAKWTADVQRGLGLVPWPVGAYASQRLGPYFPQCLKQTPMTFISGPLIHAVIAQNCQSRTSALTPAKGCACDPGWRISVSTPQTL